MFDQQNSVGQALVGQQQTPPQQDPQGNAPLADRMQQFQGPQQQQPQQQAPPQQKQPTPEEADAAHHTALGRFAHLIMGNQRQYSVDPQTGKTIETTVAPPCYHPAGVPNEAHDRSRTAVKNGTRTRPEATPPHRRSTRSVR